MASSTFWPHAPDHRLSESGTYIVTAGTYGKRHFFKGVHRLKSLHDGLLRYAMKYRWRLQAWAVFPNHYHFVAHSPDDNLNGAESLRVLLADFHQHSASWVNKRDGVNGRKVWHNYWETLLTFEKSYFARLNYVHQNAVKHGVVSVAANYPYCSASWFERITTPAMIRTIYGFKVDRIQIVDDY